LALVVAVAAADHEVAIENFAFVPAELTLHRGDSVTWRNRDETPHNVVADAKGFASPPLDSGDSYRVTFDQAGEFGYFCRLHPHMTGRITVLP
jgi:plastocyanin